MTLSRTLALSLVGAVAGAVAAYASIWGYVLAIGERESPTMLSRVVAAVFYGVAFRAALMGAIVGICAQFLYTQRRLIAGPGIVTLAAIAGTLFAISIVARSPHVVPITATIVSILTWGVVSLILQVFVWRFSP